MDPEIELRNANAALEEQFKKFDAVGAPGAHGEGVLTREGAILQMRVAQLLAARINRSAHTVQHSVLNASHQINASTDNIRTSMNNFEKALAKSIDGLATESGETGRALAKWTKWLAFGTFLLGAATVALVAVEIWAVLRGH